MTNNAGKCVLVPYLIYMDHKQCDRSSFEGMVPKCTTNRVVTEILCIKSTTNATGKCDLVPRGYRRSMKRQHTE